MSGIINRIREGVHEATRPKDTTTTSNSGVPEGTAGPHNSRVANAADPRVDSDLDGRAQHHHTTHTTHTGPGQISPTNDTFGSSTTSTTAGSTNAGPHKSNIANKLDPRVDSDLDGSRNAGMNQTTNRTGNTFSSGSTTTTGSTNAGPHNSNLANKLDPRVDSDLDGSRNAGMNQTTSTTGHTNTFSSGTTTTSGSTNAGPHKSNLANKLDPRVDSDLDGSRNAGMNQTTNASGRTGTVGTGTHYGGSTNAGPHDSNMANKMDPRVDSDLDGSRNMGMNQTSTASGRPMGTTATTGHTTTTGHSSGSTNAGPHKSNLLNKLDPRVDSDLDGSSNAGMNQTTRPNY